jgi:hypothetical protein
LPAPGVDVAIVDDAASRDVAGVVVHKANGSSTVLPDPPEAGQVLTGGPTGPAWGAPGGEAGVPVFVQADQPADPVAPSVWIPLDAQGVPLPPDQWQVFA